MTTTSTGAPKGTPKQPPTRVGIVGTGGWAGAHAGSYHHTEGCTLRAVYDVNAERAAAFAARHGADVVAPDLDALLGEVDAVSVVVPDRFHAEVAIAALRARVHVLTEKPLATSLDEARAVAAEAQRAGAEGVVHMINLSKRNAACFGEAAGLVASGALGEIRHVHASYRQHWLAADTWRSWHDESFLWRCSTADGSGGVLGDLGPHMLDMATAIAGEARRIRCDLRTFPKMLDGRSVTEHRGKPLDANDTAIVEMELDAGPVALVQMTRWATGHPNSETIEVYGTEGGLMFDLAKGGHRLWITRGEARHAPDWTERVLPGAPSVQQRFIGAIRDAGPADPDILRGARVQAYLDACERSHASGTWTEVLPHVAG